MEEPYVNSDQRELYSYEGSYQQTNSVRNYDQQQVADSSDRPAKRYINVFGTYLDHDLLVAKAFYFFFYAAFGSLFPLIGIYFKQLGLSPSQAGLLIGIRPFIEFVSSPFWGSFAGKFRKAKILLIFALICWIAFTVPLSWISPPTPFCLDSNSTTIVLYPAKELRGTQATEEKSLSELKILDKRIKAWQTAGISPEVLDPEYVKNYNPEEQGILVRPPTSSRVYLKSSVDEVFMLLLLLVVLGEFFSSPAAHLVDSCTLSHLEGQVELYGRQRIVGSFGWAIAMFIVGIVLDFSKSQNHPCGVLENSEKDYKICFTFFTILMILAILTTLPMQFTTSVELPFEVREKIMEAQNKDVDPAVAENARARGPKAMMSEKGPQWFATLKTFASCHYIAFLVVTWWMGFGGGLVFGFLFWHLQDFGGSPTLFGIASVINHISEILAFMFSVKLINRIGHIKVLYVGLIANVLRFLYVSWVKNPWAVLPFEFVQGITHATVWAAASSYISLASPATQKTSAQGILQGLHHGLGRGLGALISGFVINYHGTVAMFRAYALICLVVLLFFILANRFFKAEGIKYRSDGLMEDGGGIALAPHGIPMSVPYSPNQERRAPVGSYGATAPDPTQDAYDKYVQGGSYQNPVQIEPLPGAFGTGL